MTPEIDGLKSSDLAARVGVEPVTIRKYALHFEAAGYAFIRTPGGRRIYTEQDAMLFTQAKHLQTETGISVENACAVVVGKHRSMSAPAPTQEGSALVRYDERYAEMTERIDHALQQIPELLAEVQLLRRENAEVKALLAASIEATATEKRRWWRFGR